MTWAHATNSRKEFQEALASTSVKAIECDIMMNRDHPPEPILSHPPSTESDLAVRQMIQLIMGPHEDERGDLKKHLKLDFKEIEALKPTLDLILDSDFRNTMKNQIFLNADILPGPGFEPKDPSIVSPSQFLETSLSCIQRFRAVNPQILFSFSLGFKCDWQSDEGYSSSQVSQMSNLVDEYQLASSDIEVGIVLALNARQLSKSLAVFDCFLRDYPKSTILAW
eukprot:CAMPEP_0116125262 /NCGR_PEP_ID=MMETSP0329-20121206/5718_1 /TAXON_ID=697910 /ORGANISM="Pseudo-nitzschia arenysensis, Strain B593" /LENGTH=223 /DNA_ID=CAMNT_0003619293 /DNA_START=56 /DNA_END=724 /DNA_ORIENTATION=+